MSRLRVRRIVAYVADLLCVYLWGAALFLLTRWLLGDALQEWVGRDPWRGQLVGLLSMTLPVVLAFAAFEAQDGATPGKRLCRLRVRTADGSTLRFRHALARNCVKFAPWELGHLSAWQAIHAEGTDPPVWAAAVGIVAAALPLWWISATLIHGRCPYDGWTHTKVENSAPRAA